ncbi:MAG: hypothetical protein HQK83_07530 [Fibrobacteria bacterium]|nr:hypothetical protein [Fibrobacteria bacterium]
MAIFFYFAHFRSLDCPVTPGNDVHGEHFLTYDTACKPGNDMFLNQVILNKN